LVFGISQDLFGERLKEFPEDMSAIQGDCRKAVEEPYVEVYPPHPKESVCYPKKAVPKRGRPPERLVKVRDIACKAAKNKQR
jgi:hypothetical protein